MTAAQDRIKSLKFQGPEYIPISASILPAAWMQHREAMDEIVARHPILFGEHKAGDRDYDQVGLFPFCTPQEIDDHIREAVERLGSPEGGLWLKAEIGFDVPLDNVEAICSALEKYRSYFS